MSGRIAIQLLTISYVRYEDGQAAHAVAFDRRHRVCISLLTTCQSTNIMYRRIDCRLDNLK